MSTDRPDTFNELGHTSPIMSGATTANTAHERFRAAHVVAAQSRDAADCALLLAMLGLTAAEGLPASRR
ncbi:hypothetical protein [Actinokineospora sp. HUAS TT18]|uniref:hypothetical protein n=1 Tax=Actinokineospora sp. HUAS TT18 TaxID=3447451 RepID=UPI003F526DF3